VLSNYSFPGSALAVDEDITKRARGAASKQTSTRLRKELQAIAKDPPPFIYVNCDEGSILKWDFLIEGPPDTAYDGGWYWGRVDIPKDYPFWPPLIRFYTPNGRFEADSWLCRSLLDYHTEGWQPPWTIASVLIALLSLMVEDSFTSGALHPPRPVSERRRLAQESLAWNKEQADFRSAFPEVEQIVNKRAAERNHASSSTF